MCRGKGDKKEENKKTVLFKKQKKWWQKQKKIRKIPKGTFCRVFLVSMSHPTSSTPHLQISLSFPANSPGSALYVKNTGPYCCHFLVFA
jgi:hypothetical protein